MTRPVPALGEKRLIWIGSSKRDLKVFPPEVKRAFGLALGRAQYGEKDPHAKPWKGDGPGVMEIVADHRGDTFRAVYTVRFEQAVYALHTFQKKSKTGIKTSEPDRRLIASRLRNAQQDYEERYGDQSS